jgi:FlaA1/EpsC-like NDP-sugar epimerase
MAEQLISKDDGTADTDYHKQTRAQENIQTVEDREYTKEEVKNAIEEQKPKKSPG